MPFRIYSPLTDFLGFITVGILELFSRRRKRWETPEQSTPQPTEEEQNISAMQKVVAEYDGYSAEVFNISVFGRRRVETFRLLTPGKRVELKMKKGDIKVFAYGEYIAELIPPVGSNLERLFEEEVRFDAYLGGRDRVFLNSETYDSCSIIVFYKLDGVPPTKVNLK